MPVDHVVVEVRTGVVQLLHGARVQLPQLVQPGSRSMTVAMVIAWSSCSTIAAEHSASYSIQKHCSAEEVG